MAVATDANAVSAVRWLGFMQVSITRGTQPRTGWKWNAALAVSLRMYETAFRQQPRENRCRGSHLH